MVDLGKPAFKLGISEMKVGWGAHELKVSVSTDKKVYQVRQKALVRIRVQGQDLKPPTPQAARWLWQQWTRGFWS